MITLYLLQVSREVASSANVSASIRVEGKEHDGAAKEERGVLFHVYCPEDTSYVHAAAYVS